MSDLEKKLISEFEDKEYAHAYMDSHLIDRISTQIYQLRLQRGWTQQQLAEKSGIAQERISLLESGDFTSITMKTLRKLAEAFDVAISIKFESFADAIMDFVGMSIEKLQVKSRIESIHELNQSFLAREQWPNIDSHVFERYKGMSINKVRMNASKLILTAAESGTEARQTSWGVLLRGIANRQIHHQLTGDEFVHTAGETINAEHIEDKVMFDDSAHLAYSDWQGSLIRSQK